MPCGRSLSWHGRLLYYVANRPDPALPVAIKGQPHVVRVEQVTVEAGGQAIVGAVSQGGGGNDKGNNKQPHAPAALAREPSPTLRGPDPEREPVPVGGRKG